MLIRLIVTTCFIIHLAHAEEISVNYGFMKFRLSFDKQEAKLTGKNMSLSLDRTACNAHIFDEFKKNVEHSLEGIKINLNPSQEKIKVNFKKKTSYFERKSPEGKYFIDLPYQFKKVKIKSQLKCTKSRKL